MSLRERDSERARLFTRRGFVIGGIQAALLTGLGVRLGWLQVVQGQHYHTLAEENRIDTKLIAPSRGEIVDRFGVPLAVNKRDFRVLLTAEQTEDVDLLLDKLHKIVPLHPRDIERVLKKIKQRPKYVPIEVKNGLNWQQVSEIEVNLPDLTGLATESADLRSYPLGESTAHLTGYVGRVNEADLKKGEKVLSLPGFRIGKSGLEKSFEKTLRGQAGTRQMEVNAYGRDVRELKRRPPQTGKRVSLTIDSGLQMVTQKRLEQETSAAAVVMDAHTGSVYALANAPAYDPNMFVTGLSAEQWEEWLNDPALPLNNKACSGQYPPGSTFKMVTALAALEKGIINHKTVFRCPGHYDVGPDRFHCWKHSGHGWVDLKMALAQSCDVFFYEISREVGIDNIAAMGKKLGLGEKYGFDLHDERAGLMPTKDWKLGHLGKKWRPGETIVASIGQGYVQATPLQLAVMTARLVNGGKAVTPHIVDKVGDEQYYNAQQWPKMDIPSNHLRLVQRGMNAVTMHEKGTAYKMRIEDPQYAMGGKSGTSQVRRITRAQRKAGIKRQEDLPWEHRHHALFVAYAPIKKPRYICSVIVEHGISGSGAAAPIARDLLLEVQKRRPDAPQSKTKPEGTP